MEAVSGRIPAPSEGCGRLSSGACPPPRAPAPPSRLPSPRRTGRVTPNDEAPPPCAGEGLCGGGEASAAEDGSGSAAGATPQGRRAAQSASIPPATSSRTSFPLRASTISNAKAAAAAGPLPVIMFPSRSTIAPVTTAPLRDFSNPG